MNKNMSEESHKKIFISHSSKDKQIVDIFVDKLLHLGLQIDPNDVAYTSREETTPVFTTDYYSIFYR